MTMRMILPDPVADANRPGVLPADPKSITSLPPEALRRPRFRARERGTRSSTTGHAIALAGEAGFHRILGDGFADASNAGR